MKNSLKQKVALGLSGGVDSSVAAYLLKGNGFEVVGVNLLCWDTKGEGCSGDEGRVDAVRVASKLRIKFKPLNFIKEYKKKVIDLFYKEYEEGRTPNPDILCNKEIKFGIFYDWAVKKGFDYVATGHYARIEKKGNVYKLLKGVDNTKDQSYFLYLLDQSHFSKILFPLGEMKKSDVRKIAKDAGLHNYDKPDSVGICFVGEVNLKKFLEKKIKSFPGKVLDEAGNVIGDHAGAVFYTIGQRHGFKINKHFGHPLYVISKDIGRNELVVGMRENLRSKEFKVSNVHWISSKPGLPLTCMIRIRHLGEFYRAKIEEGVDSLKISLEEFAYGVAPGQSAVFYDGDEVLGGGVIL